MSNAQYLSSADTYGEYKHAALFGRLTYNWDNKYVINISGRRDGSSRFGSGKQYGNFGAVGAAWLLSEEPWFRKFRFISFAKLRGSYGTTGSDAIGDYGYLTRWSSNGVIPYNGISGLIPTQHANPDFQWQVSKGLEGSIELGFCEVDLELPGRNAPDGIGKNRSHRKDKENLHSQNGLRSAKVPG